MSQFKRSLALLSGLALSLELSIGLSFSPKVLAIEPTTAATESFCPSLLAPIAALLERPFVDAKFSAAYLSPLVPLTDRRLESEFGFNPGLAHIAAAGFRHQHPKSEALDITHHFMERPSPKQVAVVFIMRARDEIVGFLALTIEKQGDQREAWSEFMKVDRNRTETHGISYSYSEFIPKFYRAMGVTTERIEAGWVGRTTWAKPEFGYSLDPEAQLTENGIPLPQAEVIRRNFERFLRYHQIDIQDLYLQTSSGDRAPISDLSELQTTADYLGVRHRAGPVVSVAPYVDVDTLGEPFQAHPGLAFTQWDYRPRPGQTTSIDQKGKALSDIAMPTWIGIRHLP